jgi:predicted enzyme related to lactoylglutathione lyase
MSQTDTDSTKSGWSCPSLGTPCWVSIPANDVPRAKSFYEKVFDWKFRESPDAASYPATTFAMFYTPTPILMGAIVKCDQDTANKPGVGIDIYLLVDDIEGTFEKAKSEGGGVAMEKVPDGDHTLRGKVTDTEGNVIGILKWLRG